MRSSSDAPRGDTVYIFHHMPKCGGTAMRKALEGWFTTIHDYITHEELRTRKIVRPPVPLADLKAKSCICSHFEIPENRLASRYPEVLRHPERFVVFSLVRDPFALRVSLYYHEVRGGFRDPGAQSLAEYLRTGHNYMADRFGCSPDDYERVLGLYDFIGVQECLQESLDRLARLCGLAPLPLERHNVGIRDEQVQDLTDEDRRLFRENNRLDYRIYEYARRRWLDDPA